MPCYCSKPLPLERLHDAINPVRLKHETLANHVNQPSNFFRIITDNMKENSITSKGLTNLMHKAFQAFDEYNKQDPHVFNWEGQAYPNEYFLSLKLHGWVTKLAPTAGEALLLASRCQHIGRWEIPRNDYPRDRAGYLKWRKKLALHHADKASQILTKVGYASEIIERVHHIVLKRKLKADADVQTMENALCLVFLQFQYEAFWPQHTDKIVGILRKSLQKMDADGHEHALRLNYSDLGKYYIEQALSQL